MGSTLFSYLTVKDGIITQIVEFVCILTLLIMFFHGIIYLLKEWLDEENMP